MERTGNLVLATVVLFCAPILLFALPAPERFAVNRAGIGGQPLTGGVVADEGSLADVLGRQRVDPRFEPFVERARVKTSMITVEPGTRLIGYETNTLGRFCGLLIVDDEGGPLEGQKLEGCTSHGPPVLASDGQGTAYVAWERDHRQVVVSRYGGEIASLLRPVGSGALSPVVAFELRPLNRVLLTYGDEVVELSGGGAWPDGPLSRARVAIPTFGQAISWVSFAVFVIFGLLATRHHQRLRLLPSLPTHDGRVQHDGSARPVLVTHEGASFGLELGQAEILGDPQEKEWLVVGSAQASGEGVYRASAQLIVKTVYAGVVPDVLHTARRNHFWLLALVSLFVALTPWFAAAFG